MTIDVQGLLSLDEATHLRVHREDILEEALAFATTSLKSLLPLLNNPFAEKSQSWLIADHLQGLDKGGVEELHVNLSMRQYA